MTATTPKPKKGTTMPKDRTGSERWQRRPAEEDVGIRYPIWRVSANRKHKVIVLSHDLIGCYTHYFRSRTQPCEIDDCQACQANCGRRWHGWLFTKLIDSPQIGILELTAKSTGPIDDYFRRTRTLRGAYLHLHRAPQKPNGRVIASLADSGVSGDSLPQIPAVQDILLQMWEISGKRATKLNAADNVLPLRKPEEGGAGLARAVGDA